ncbi:hypothetical protein SUDANB13_03513 [Streptomyces sp. enrichment culture]
MPSSWVLTVPQYSLWSITTLGSVTRAAATCIPALPYTTRNGVPGSCMDSFRRNSNWSSSVNRSLLRFSNRNSSAPRHHLARSGYRSMCS